MLFTIFTLSLVLSCNENELQVEDQFQQEESISEDPFANIPRLENPYTVENMKKALESLKSKNGKGYSDIKIFTTHYYIKFTPRNEREYDILKSDSLLDLYRYPLDVEELIIPQAMALNRQSEKPPTLWCAVKVEHKLPKGSPYKILEHLYIPNEDKIIRDEKNSNDNITFAEELVDEALRITGNLEEEQDSPLSSRASKWRPAGTILVWDDNLSRWIGVEGVEVRARKWFITHKGIANASGYYSCDGRFQGKANYSIDWERYQFAIQDGWLNGATYNGPKKKGDWNLSLNSGNQEYYATIFRAAHHYYYKNIKGLRRPPSNSFFKTQLKIRAYLQNVSDDGSLGTHKEERRFLGAQLKIYTYGKKTRDTYKVVIHELAHASHWNMWREADDFDDTEDIVKESWARGVEWELTRMVYPTYSADYSRQRYTGVVEDMIDGFKTRTSYYYWTEDDSWIRSTKSYSDRVSSYSIRQLEDALKGEKTWNDWKNNIINKYNNETASKLHDSFNHWNTE